MSDGTPRTDRWTRIAIRAWAAIGVLILLAAVGWLLGAISSALVPFGIGLLIVLMLRHPVDLLARHMNRILAVSLCYLVGFVVLGAALTFLLPPVYAQIAQFISAVPHYAQQGYSLWNSFVAQGSGAPAWLQSAVVALKDQIVAGAGSWSSAIASIAVSAGGSIASGLIGLVMAFVIGFYTLSDLPRLQREVYLLVGERSRGELSHALTTITRVLGGWVRGTLIQSTVIGTLIAIGLSIAGVPYALALGVFGGVLNVVPYVGPAIVAVLAGVAGLFVAPITALWAVVIVLAAQQFDGIVMAPRIMSEQVDLHPLLVIFSLLVGASLFGIPGMVLAIPVAAVLKALLVYWLEKRSERQIFSEDGVLFRATKADGPVADGDAADGDVAVEPVAEPAGGVDADDGALERHDEDSHR
jgi:predicted PurR-regulated permease PerM